MDEKYINEEILYQHNSEEVIDHRFDDNEKMYSIQKKKRISHQFILSIQPMKYI